MNKNIFSRNISIYSLNHFQAKFFVKLSFMVNYHLCIAHQVLVQRINIAFR